MLSPNQIKELIGPDKKNTMANNEYYIKIAEKNKIPEFNWAAAFLGPLWFYYRRMYFLGSFFGAGFFFFSGGFLWMIPFITYGFLGNRIYLRFLSDMNDRNIKNLEVDSRAIKILFILGMLIISLAIPLIILVPSLTKIEESLMNFLNFELFPLIIAMLIFGINISALWFFGKEKRQAVFFWPIGRRRNS